MHKATCEVAVGFHDSIGSRWAAALRRRHATPKHAARAYGVALATATGWFHGQPPQGKHLQRAVATDPQILTEVHAPGHVVVPEGDPKAQLAAAIERADRAIAALEEVRRMLEKLG